MATRSWAGDSAERFRLELSYRDDFGVAPKPRTSTRPVGSIRRIS